MRVQALEAHNASARLPLIFIGCIFIADPAYDEHQGVVDALSPRGARRYVIARRDDPEQFATLWRINGFVDHFSLAVASSFLASAAALTDSIRSHPTSRVPTHSMT